ncbi:porin family protein [Gaoshiqia sediminis]|uniref:PorT family protein n=1 Tax=Gaoshiqia sediminis TaxID=2986998 RepID=A0AA41Y967_9BACT|nr:porin family protein [Gaoshiqia sediminis]MCW0484419.1 PorT family protein [Gaoshiqia sediminis]
MKRILFLLAIVLFGISATGQRIGVKAGVSFSNANFEIMDLNLSPEGRTGIHFGFTGEFPLTGTLFLNPGVLFSQKGYKYRFDDEFGLGSFSGKDNMNYLEIPVNLMFKADLKGPKLLLQAGPVFGVGLNGKSFFNGDQEDIEFGGDDDQLDRMDFSLSIGGGLEYGHLQLTVNNAFGLSDITHSNDVHIKHKVFAMSLAYLFGE